MISLVRFVILSVFITTLSLCGFVASATADQTPVHTQVQKPVLIAELTVPRPTSIFSYCPDGTPLGITSSQRLKWSCIDISKDGKLLLTGDHLPSRFYESKLWKIDNGELVRSLLVENYFAPTQFSQDGKHVIGAGTEIMGITGLPTYGTAFAVWQVENGELVRARNLPRFTASVTFSPDSSILAIQGITNVVITDFPAMEMIGSVSKVREGSRLAFSPDNKLLAVTAKPSGLLVTVKSGAYIWDIPNNKLHMHIAKKEKNCCQMFAFNNDSSKLATAYHNGFDIWDVASGKKLTSIITDSDKNHSRITRSIAFSADGKKIARIVQDGRKRKIDIWDIKQKKELISFIEKAPKGKFLDSPDWKSMVRPWDAIVHPKLGIILIKYDSIYPRIIAAEEEAGPGDYFEAYQTSRKTPDDLKISIWRLEDMTRIFNSPE